MTSALRIGVVMDPIQRIQIGKDTTFALLLEAQARGWELRYLELPDLYLQDGEARGRHRGLSVRDDPDDWYRLGGETDGPLGDMDVVLMRKDPPVDMEYVYATHILERAEADGVMVVNRPAALRDTNEKIATAWFPQCCVPTLVSRDPERLRRFLHEQRETIMKPLDSMGGHAVFRVCDGDLNTNVIIETLTQLGERHAMIQRFIPEISAGDKRIILVDGEPIPFAYARIPARGEARGNLAAGGRGAGQPLIERDWWICSQVGPELRQRGLLFVGLDVIGDFLTEINVTSPTCARELDALFGLNIAGTLWDAVERRRAMARPAVTDPPSGPGPST
jgi:glutathione synthase